MNFSNLELISTVSRNIALCIFAVVLLFALVFYVEKLFGIHRQVRADRMMKGLANKFVICLIDFV